LCIEGAGGEAIEAAQHSYITLSAEKYDMESCTKKWSQTTASAVQLCKAFEHIGSP